jgi:hypothetical protein
MRINVAPYMARNRTRRAIGIVVCLAPAILAVASMVIASQPVAIRGAILLLPGSAVAALNFYRTFIGPRFHPSGPHASGLPMIGTLLCVLALIANFGSLVIGLGALVLLAIDTGGLPWFLAWTWSDESMWDR